MDNINKNNIENVYFLNKLLISIIFYLINFRTLKFQFLKRIYTIIFPFLHMKILYLLYIIKYCLNDDLRKICLSSDVKEIQSYILYIGKGNIEKTMEILWYWRIFGFSMSSIYNHEVILKYDNKIYILYPSEEYYELKSINEVDNLKKEEYVFDKIVF